MTAARLAIVGPRRVRQGLGPFVARELEAAGAEVTSFLCSRPESVPVAADELQGLGCVTARGYHDLEELFRSEALDALAILSPPETHGHYLEAALERGLHVFCEKPLVWGESRPGERAKTLAAGFEAAGLLLIENSQWPETLAGFEALHPGVLKEAPSRFHMRLSPSSMGVDMLVDSLSHPLSLLQAWCSLSSDSTEADRVENASFKQGESEGEPAVWLTFGFCRGHIRVAAEIELVRQVQQPRRACFALNGRLAERLVDMSDYSMLFADGDRRVALEDPLALRVARFVEALHGKLDAAPPADCRHRMPPRAASPAELGARMEMLEQLVGAFERAD